MINDVLLPDDVRGYIMQHSIDKTMVTILNDVVKAMPKDPLEQIVCDLAKLSTSPPTFVAFERDLVAPPAELRFHVLVAVRGVKVRLHSLSAGCLIVSDKPEPKETPPPAAEVPAPKKGAKASPTPPPMAEPEPVEELDSKEAKARRLRQLRQEEELLQFLEAFLARTLVDVYVDDFLSNFAASCKGLAEAPCPEGCELDVATATAAIIDDLTKSASGALHMTQLGYLQGQLRRAGAPVSPPLRGCSFVDWRSRWPSLAVPIFHGGGPSALRPASLRCCVALRPFAASGSAAELAGSFVGEEAAGACPPLGWVSSNMQSLRTMPGEALKMLQADKATAALAADGIAYGHPAGLAKTLDMTQEAMKKAGIECADEASGVLFAHAEEAWLAEEGVYELEAGKKLTLDQLVDLFADIAESGWLRMIVNPFRLEDISSGCELLRAKRPELRLVVDWGEVEPPREAPQGAAYSCLLHFADTLPETIEHYVALAPSWAEAAGCGVCAVLDGKVALSSAIDVAMAFSATEVVLVPPGIADEDIKNISMRADETLHEALFHSGGIGDEDSL